MKPLIQILLILLCHITLAQPNTVWFEEVVDENDNSIHGVKQILQDREGFIWLCYRDAIGKFDGYNFKHYSRKELVTSSFKSNAPSLVFEDKKQNLWIVTDAGALMQYLPDVDRFQVLNDTTRRIEGSAYSFAEDDHGNFWIGSTGGGLYKVNLKNGVFKNYRTQSKDTTTINNDFVTALTFDNKK